MGYENTTGLLKLTNTAALQQSEIRLNTFIQHTTDTGITCRQHLWS